MEERRPRTRLDLRVKCRTIVVVESVNGNLLEVADLTITRRLLRWSKGADEYLVFLEIT